MTHLASIARNGYYPFPPEFLPYAAKLVKPANFVGARGFDLTAGEGDAIAFLANALNFTPYVNEYDYSRSSACTEKFGPLQSMRGDMFDLDISHRSAHFGWLNPPFQYSSMSYGRTEINYFDFQMKYFAENAVVMFVCYIQHLSNKDMTDLIYTNLDNVTLYQCPGEHIDSYQLMLVVGTKAKKRELRLRDEKASVLLNERAVSHYNTFKALQKNPMDTELAGDLAGMFTNIMEVDEPVYDIPYVEYGRYFKFHFSQQHLDESLMCSIAQTHLPSILDVAPDAVLPREIKKEQRVIIQPRARQIQALIASGLINNFVVDTPEGLAIIRAVTRQVEVEVKQDKPADVDPESEATEDLDSDGDDLNLVAPEPEVEADGIKKVVTRFIKAPKTIITLLYQNGRVDNITEDDKLAEFIAQNAEEIMMFVQQNFVPDYKFDFVEGKVARILNNYRLPKVDKQGKVQRKRMYAAQKHVSAALFAKLSKDKAAILAGEMGVGKLQPLSSRIYTPDGYKTMGEIKVGDCVIAQNGSATKVLAIFPHPEMDIYEVTFTDGSKTRCGLDHLWEVNSPLRKARGQSGQVKTLGEIMKKPLAHKNGNWQNFIPMVEAVEFEPKELPVSPYVLGVLIGDGGLTGGTPLISSADQEILDAVQIESGCELVKCGKYDYRISAGARFATNPFTEKLKSTGLMGKDSFDKFIPKNYLYSAVHQRINLLQGLMDTDGNVSGGSNSNGEYTTVSKQLSEDVKELVQSLGGTVHITERYTTYEYKGEKKTGALSYRLQFVVPFGIMPFRLARKRNLYNMPTKYNPTRAMTKIELVGKELAQCILIEDEQHLYVTDEFIVTHNTAIAAAVLDLMKYREKGDHLPVFQHIQPESRIRPDQFNIILSPPHLVNKWVAEIKGMFPKAYIGVVASGSGIKPIVGAMNFIKGIDSQPVDALKVLIISREMVKVGESQPLTSKVYTPSGYKLMGDIKVGDVVSTPDGKTSNVVSIHPQGELDIYKVTFKDGRSVECTENHLWNVTNSQRKYKGLPFQVKSLKEIMEKPLAYPGKPSEYLNYVPLVESVHFDDKVLPIDPYVLGILLGDGSLSGKEVKFASADPEIVEQVRNNIPSGFKVSQYGDIEFAIVMDSRTGSKSSFLESLRELGLKGHKADTKFVPELYKYNSVDKRIALLQGLFDSDGTVAGKGKQAVDFAVTSKQLADDIQEIAQSLGAKVTRSYREGGYKEVGQSLPIHRLYISFPRSIKPFRLTRKMSLYNPGNKWDSMQPIVSIELVRKDLAQCILIDSEDHLYVTDGCVVTHNTWEPAFKNQRDYRKLLGAATTDAQFISEREMKNLLIGNPSSPVTGMPVEKFSKGGVGVKYTAETLSNRRHHQNEEYSWSGNVRRTKKQRPYPLQTVRLENALKQAKREADAGREAEGEYIYYEMLKEIRAGRAEYDDRRAPLNFLWQEARDLRGKENPGRKLATALGKSKRTATVRGFTVESDPYVLPFPEVAKGNLSPADYMATHMKHPRAGLQGLAKFLAEKFGDRIYMLIADEVHEYAAGDDSAQGLALLRLAGAAKKLLYMTGTLYKGVASSLYYIEFTTNMDMRRKYPWGKIMKFVDKMGVLERVVTVKTGVDGKNSKKETKTERVTEKPGCAAELLEQIIDHTIFLSIEEVGADIPPRTDKGVPVFASKEMARIYREADDKITNYLNSLLSRGDSSFLGAAFHAMMNWMNWPFDAYPVWHRYHSMNLETGKREVQEYLVHTIPAIGSQDMLLNKDKVILEDIKDSIARGRGVAVYFHQTGLHANKPNKDILKRFENLLKLHVPGAKPAILRASVSTTKREEWIEKQRAKGVNVLLCNANLVKTGLDLLWAQDIKWYELDYSLPTVDQASGRAKRIGQDQETSVMFYFNVLPPKPKQVVIKTNISGIEFKAITDVDEMEEAGLIAPDDPFFDALNNMDFDMPLMGDEYTSDWPESFEAEEGAGTIDDVLSDLGLESIEEEPLVPLGDFEWNTMEAQGILIVDKKRAASRFLYGQAGGSLSSVADQHKTLAEELAEAISKKETKVMSASDLFRKAVETEAKDEEMSSDFVDPFDEEMPEEILSETLVMKVKKARRPWTPKKKQYIPNTEAYNELLGIVPEPVVTPEPEVIEEVIPELTFEEPEVIEVVPTYPIIVRPMDMRGDKWKEDYSKFGKPTEREPEAVGESKAWIFNAGAGKAVAWLKTFEGFVDRRSMTLDAEGNFTIVGIARYK